MRLAILTFLALSALPAFAGDKTNIRYQAITTVDFTKGLNLEGELLKPMGELIVANRKAHFTPFLKLRTSFSDRVQEDSRSHM